MVPSAGWSVDSRSRRCAPSSRSSSTLENPSGRRSGRPRDDLVIRLAVGLATAMVYIAVRVAVRAWWKRQR